MPTFMMSLNWTDQGIRSIKDSPKRSQAARDLAKKVGVEIKHLYLTSGDSDLVIFVDAPSGDNVAKFGTRPSCRIRTIEEQRMGIYCNYFCVGWARDIGEEGNLS